MLGPPNLQTRAGDSGETQTDELSQFDMRQLLLFDELVRRGTASPDFSQRRQSLTHQSHRGRCQRVGGVPRRGGRE